MNFLHKIELIQSETIRLARLHPEIHNFLHSNWLQMNYRNSRTLAYVDFFNREIHFNSDFINDARKGQILKVLYHELAHVIVGGENLHNKVWRTCCKRIGGGKQKATCNFEFKRKGGDEI